MINRHRLRRLLAPTAGLRRAFLTLILGLLIFAIGFALSFKVVLLPLMQRTAHAWTSLMEGFVSKENLDFANHLLGGAMLVLGIFAVFAGVRDAVRTLNQTLNPGTKSGLVNLYVRKQMLAQGPRIVALGGGTGLSTLLRGLKQHSSNITAVVTVTDDGGSSGRLKQEMGILPPGDLRNCLVALADAEKLMTDLFQHRFQGDAGSLSGHSIGNLLIAALVDQHGGDVEKAIELASNVLAIRGRVVPSTLTPVRLRALMENGQELCGETQIAGSQLKVHRIFLDPEDAQPYPVALEAIQSADLICVGPGSIYTSVIPNLLVPGLADAIKASSAVKAYICNVMTQPGESDAFSAAEHILAIQANVPVKTFDWALVNTGIPSQETLEKYRDSGQYFVEPDVDRIRTMGIRVATGDYMSEADYVRHDPQRVASRLLDLLNR